MTRWLKTRSQEERISIAVKVVTQILIVTLVFFALR